MLHICKYGDPVLRVKAAPVTSVNAGIRKDADKMLALMMQKNGVGLAAQQVGKTIRIFTMYVPPQHDVSELSGERMNPSVNDPVVMINPEILSRSGIMNANEGCLSIPDISAPVRRAYEVAVSFLDLDGKRSELVLKGLMARVIQHEIDHLDAILFVDRVSRMQKIALAARLRKLKRSTEEGKASR